MDEEAAEAEPEVVELCVVVDHPLEAPAAVWDPVVPLLPGPAPAPLVMYLLAPDGMFGKMVGSSTSQMEDLAGQGLADPEDLYPPSPDG